MLRAATAFAALAKSLVAGADVPQMSPVANIVIKKDSGVGKLRFVKLSGISSGIADSNSLEIKVIEKSALLHDLVVILSCPSFLSAGRRKYHTSNSSRTSG